MDTPTILDATLLLADLTFTLFSILIDQQNWNMAVDWTDERGSSTASNETAHI